MNLSNEITNMILDMMDGGASAEIRRNDLAQSLGCVPSQINYVLSSRFTPEHGYIVESRRGGGGYIKITRVSYDFSSALMRTVNSIGQSIDAACGRAYIMNLYSSGFLDGKTASIMLSAIDDKTLKSLVPEARDEVRASILKQMLLASGKDD